MYGLAVLFSESGINKEIYMRVLSGDRKKGVISRFVKTVLFLAVVLMATLWFAARTEGGRGFVESELSKRLGIKVTIESMRIGWPYVLVMDNLRTPEFEAAGTAGFSVVEARLGRSLQYWNIRLKQSIVRIKKDEEGSWKPGSAARLGDLKDAGIIDIVKLTDGLRKRVRLRVTKSNVEWLDRDGAVTAFARDVDFRMLPAYIDDRKFHYYVLNIYNSSGISLDSGRDMHWEWLTTAEVDYIELPGSSGAERKERDEQLQRSDESTEEVNGDSNDIE